MADRCGRGIEPSIVLEGAEVAQATQSGEREKRRGTELAAGARTEVSTNMLVQRLAVIASAYRRSRKASIGPPKRRCRQAYGNARKGIAKIAESPADRRDVEPCITMPR